MLDAPSGEGEVREFLSVAEVAEVLAVHEATVRRYIKQGSLRAAKVGGRIRVRRADLDLFVNRAAGPALPAVRGDFEMPIPQELGDTGMLLLEELTKLREEIGYIAMYLSELVRQQGRRPRSRPA